MHKNVTTLLPILRVLALCKNKDECVVMKANVVFVFFFLCECLSC